MASKRKRAPREFRWSSSATLSLVVDRDGRRLAVIATDVGFGRWNVLAIEAATPPKLPDAAELEAELQTMEQVLEHHAHQAVGVRSTPVEALQLAENYARGWLNAPSESSAERCACGPIQGAAHG